MAELPKRAGVIVIGGGVVGASIAYHLTLRGAKDVVLLERKQLTAGTTWHAAGLVGQLRATQNLTRLAQYSAKLYAGLEAETEQATGFKQVGSISLATTPARLEELLRGASMARSFGLDVSEISAAQARDLWPLLQADDIVGGVHLPGDGQINPVDVTLALAKGARMRGARVIENVEVTEIVTDRGRAIGVRTARGLERADSVVVNADFAQAMTDLIPNDKRPHWTDERLASKKYSCSTFMLYLGVEGEYDLDHHNIFLAEDYQGNIAEIEQAQKIPDQPSIYVANPGRTDPRFARDGRSSIYVLVPVGHCGPVDWAREAPAFREKVIDRLEGFGLTNLRQRIRYERRLTPEDWREQFSIYRGATFNLAHGLDQMLYFRPHNKLGDVPGVYVVGGGTHPGSGLPVIYEGARITSDLVLADWAREGEPSRAGLSLRNARAS